MLGLKGKYTTAKIYAEKVEEGVISQVKELLNHPMFKDERIRVMADTHAGKGCVIGLTSTNKNKVIIPNIIGVDIGCAMLSINLGNIDIDLIPINMKDGSILAIGKGDVEYNNSAPHGAGRLMSRTKAKKELNMKDFKESMEGVFTTSVTDSTLDEAPLSYKPIEEILNNINDTVEVLDILKPIYNFKAH